MPREGRVEAAACDGPHGQRRPNILQVILLPGQANDESKMQKRKEKTRELPGAVL